MVAVLTSVQGDYSIHAEIWKKFGAPVETEPTAPVTTAMIDVTSPLNQYKLFYIVSLSSLYYRKLVLK